jgi:hypothetical protein
MTKVPLADVLWDAANLQLSADDTDEPLNRYSCNAVKNICYLQDIRPYEGPVQFLFELGCDPSEDEYTFGKRSGAARQGVRYMWLLLAMHVAADEKIMVEVAQ